MDKAPRQEAHPNLRRGGRRYKQLEQVEIQKARYLAGFSVDCTLTAGCKAGGVSPETVYQWREMDDEFVIHENRLRMELADRLEGEAIRRAYTGWDRPIYQKGELCGYERVYSDALLKLMLGAVRPEKFREKVDVSGTVEQIVRQVSGFSAAEVL
jgi:hypothetical protein